MIIDASDEDAFVMSLVENIARRQRRPAEQLEAIRVLSQRGYDVIPKPRECDSQGFPGSVLI